MQGKHISLLCFIVSIGLLCGCSINITPPSSSAAQAGSEAEAREGSDRDTDTDTNTDTVTCTYGNLLLDCDEAYSIFDVSTGNTGFTLLFDDVSMMMITGMDTGAIPDGDNWETLYREALATLTGVTGITTLDTSMTTFMGNPALSATGSRQNPETGVLFNIESTYFMLDTCLYALDYCAQDLELYREEYEAIVGTIRRDPTYSGDFNNALTDPDATVSADSGTPNTKMYTLGGLQLELHAQIVWDTVTDSYSEYNGVRLFRLPVTVTNTNAEPQIISVRDFTLFGPTGKELGDVGVYYTDDVGYSLLNIGPGQTAQAYFSFQHDGPGEYLIAFDTEAGQLDITFTLPE